MEELPPLCVVIHSSALSMAERFYNELKRQVYITPSNYFQLLQQFISLLKERNEFLEQQKSRYLIGLEKLAATKKSVEVMQNQLSELKPYLEKTAADTKQLMDQIYKDQEEADKVRVTITMEEAEVSVQTKEIQKMKDEAEADLLEAQPALDRAIKALNTLNKKDVGELKTFLNPPAGVLLVMEAICVLRQVPKLYVVLMGAIRYQQIGPLRRAFLVNPISLAALSIMIRITFLLGSLEF